MRLLSIILTICVISSIQVFSADLNNGLEAVATGDFQTALNEFKALSEQGDASAQYNLGYMYDKGYGIPEDAKEAVKLYRLAAEQGHASAQFNLGVGYSLGEGVPHDDKEAVKWYRLAAEQGVARAQYNLGIMYSNGEGIPANNIMAYMWCNLAGASGDEMAQKAKKQLIQSMTKEDISKAQDLSREWIKDHPDL